MHSGFEQAIFDFVVGKYESFMSLFIIFGCTNCTHSGANCSICWPNRHEDRTSCNVRISHKKFNNFLDDDSQQVLSIKSHLTGNTSALLEKPCNNPSFVFVVFPECRFRDLDNQENKYILLLSRINLVHDNISQPFRLGRVNVELEEFDDETINIIQREQTLQLDNSEDSENSVDRTTDNDDDVDDDTLSEVSASTWFYM